ncbi:MAG: HAMP domain-containing sensor histidine kinase [Campylobacterota bacterium]|nr:HAMP domain-containing sensor histidine kinase [Campylobacterota bacterium]
MIAQSRHAAMGEMISMIAHQWRQPLSVISMGANNIIADIELKTLDEKVLYDGSIEILEQTKELSKTIDDFKNFFKPIKTVEDILPEDIFNDAFNVVGKSLENNEIEVIKEFKNGKKIKTYSRELMQVFINIIKNAKEALAENKIKNRKIYIMMKDTKNLVEISICDNAGGIKSDIIDKIFNPYFSTKYEKSGTVLGLYMSKTIIEKHLNGTIEVGNSSSGACFKIKLPYEVSLEEK